MFIEFYHLEILVFRAFGKIRMNIEKFNRRYREKEDEEGRKRNR